jgi:hypothetical protein
MFDNDYGTVELISENRVTAKRALAARLRDDPNWRDM